MEEGPSLLARAGETEAEEGPSTPAVGSTVNDGRPWTPASTQGRGTERRRLWSMRAMNGNSTTQLTDSQRARVVGRACDGLRAVVVR